MASGALLVFLGLFLAVHNFEGDIAENLND